MSGSEMGHLMDGDPVIAELALGRIAADDEANGGPAKAERRAPLHVAARSRDDKDADRGDRELAEIAEAAFAEFSIQPSSAL